jgi:hypothetical protein
MRLGIAAQLKWAIDCWKFDRWKRQAEKLTKSHPSFSNVAVQQCDRGIERQTLGQRNIIVWDA